PHPDALTELAHRVDGLRPSVNRRRSARAKREPREQGRHGWTPRPASDMACVRAAEPARHIRGWHKALVAGSAQAAAAAAPSSRPDAAEGHPGPDGSLKVRKQFGTLLLGEMRGREQTESEANALATNARRDTLAAILLKWEEGVGE